MPSGYPLRKTVIQLYDGNTTPKKLTLTFYGSVPELSRPTITRTLDPKMDRGQFKYVMFGDDQIEFPEQTIEMDLVDDLYSGTKHKVLEWFNEHKDSGVALTSTNDGNAQAVDGDTLTEVQYGLPTSIFTIGMKIWFENASGANGFGYDFKYIQPIKATVSSANDGSKITLTFRILGNWTDLSAKPS